MTARPVSNPPNPFEAVRVEWQGHPDWDGPAPPARLEVVEERCRSALSRNDSPDVGFRYSVNPYRGCFHGCAYCYARPSHGYWGLGAGTDFERTIIAKVNLPEVLDRELARPGWSGEPIVLSGNTDGYQPLEARYGLTRRCLEVCRDHGNPVAIITKSALIRRDGPLLGELASRASVRVVVSIGGTDDAIGRALEPNAPAYSQRLNVLETLSAIPGVRTGVSLAPVIPGLTDDGIPKTLEAAAKAGASFAFMTMVRLPKEVRPVFQERLEAAFPGRARKVLRGIREARGGRLSDARFGARMTGEGERWRVTERVFAQHLARLGLDRSPGVPVDDEDGSAKEGPSAGFTAPRGRRSRPKAERQLPLFDAPPPARR